MTDEIESMMNELRIVCIEYLRSEVEKKKETAKEISNRILNKKSRSLSLRFRILHRDNFKCVYCGRAAKDGVILHVDHVYPKSLGGGYEEENLVTACFECNLGKKDCILTEHEIA